MLQTAWEDSEGLVRWRDMRCEEDPDDFETLRHGVWKVTDFARDDAVLLLPSASEVDWERPAQMLDALDLASVKEELGGDGLVKLGKVWGYEPTKSATTATSPEGGDGQGDEGDAEKLVGSTSRLERRIADHTRSKCREAQEATRRGRPAKVRTGSSMHVELLEGMWVSTRVTGSEKGVEQKVRLNRGGS